MNKTIPHILMVDDDDRIRELVKQYLEENNFIVTTARDAFDAKKKINIIKFDIMILDIMMPGESGLSLTKYVKEKNPTPIILPAVLIPTCPASRPVSNTLVNAIYLPTISTFCATPNIINNNIRKNPVPQ